MIDELTADYPNCAILLGGSVSRGEERPDSDLDLFVVLEGDGAIWPNQGFWAAWKEKPYHFWMFAWADILTDPSGVGKACQEPARQYFIDRPAIARLSATQTAAVYRHKRDPSHILDFPTWEDFAQHLEEQTTHLGDAH